MVKHAHQLDVIGHRHRAVERRLDVARCAVHLGRGHVCKQTHHQRVGAEKRHRDAEVALLSDSHEHVEPVGAQVQGVHDEEAHHAGGPHHDVAQIVRVAKARVHARLVTAGGPPERAPRFAELAELGKLALEHA